MPFVDAQMHFAVVREEWPHIVVSAVADLVPAVAVMMVKTQARYVVSVIVSWIRCYVHASSKF